MHSSCLALAVTWISGLCCLLESHWSCAWINVSNWLGSLLVYGASATASHCTQRGPKFNHNHQEVPKAWDHLLPIPSIHVAWVHSLSLLLRNVLTIPLPCACWCPAPSTSCMTYWLFSPLPEEYISPSITVLYCSVHWQAQGCPDPPYRPTSCFWPSNKWPSLWKKHFFMACLT